MSILVTIVVRHESAEDDLDTREFDGLPRIGETLRFTQGVDMTKPYITDIARCRVVEVVHDVRVGYTQAVHVYVVVAPESTADWLALANLYPDVLGHPGDGTHA